MDKRPECREHNFAEIVGGAIVIRHRGGSCRIRELEQQNAALTADNDRLRELIAAERDLSNEYDAQKNEQIAELQRQLHEATKEALAGALDRAGVPFVDNAAQRREDGK